MSQPLTLLRRGRNSIRLTRKHYRMFEAIRTEHPGAVVLRCGDERTGVRFGNRKCRLGRCVKLGRTTYKHQTWVSWADHDTQIKGENK